MKTRSLSFLMAAAIFTMLGCSKNETRGPKLVQEPLTPHTNSGTVAYLDTAVTNFFKRTSGSIAFDGAFSVPLSSGKVAWLTNDTYFNDYNSTTKTVPCNLFNDHNTVMMQPASHSWSPSLTTTLTASGQPNVPNGSPALFWDLNINNYIWPGAGVEIGTTVYAWANEITNVTNGFKVVGDYLASFNESNSQVNYINPPNLDTINFGVGMVKVTTGGNNYIYVYGYKPVPSGLGSNIYVARFLQSTPSSWAFWDGTTSTWVSSSASATSIGLAASNGCYVAFVNSKYVLLSTAFTLACDEGTAIYASTSTSPTGPFNTMQVIYNITDKLNGHTPYYYTPVIHTEFTANSEFLFTYCINGYEPCVANCSGSTMDPNIYRPRGVRVPFSVLGL